MPADDGGLTVFQWAATAVLGLFTLVFGGAVAHLHSRIDGIRETFDDDGGDARDRSDEREKRIWEAIDKMREQLASDRALAAADRANIAALMVTKAELRQQIDRILDVLPLRRRETP